jgi:ASC-1-like (ASCH) protein
MVKQFVLSFPIICLLAGIASCADEPKVVESKNKRVQVTLPSGWDSATLPNVSDRLIQARCPGKNAFVIVVAEPKQDLKHNSVKEYAETMQKLKAGKKTIEDRTVSEPKALKINGQDALQFEVRGTLKNVKLTYLETYIDLPAHWTCVTNWTTPSHWDEAQDDFRAIYESLRELPKSR